MTALFRLSRAAERDLLDIHDRIAKDDRAAALGFIERIEERCGLLAEFPRMGRACRDFGPEIRASALGHYIIFYQPIERGVLITQVYHGRRDLRALFEDT